MPVQKVKRWLGAHCLLMAPAETSGPAVTAGSTLPWRCQWVTLPLDTALDKDNVCFRPFSV